MRLTDLIDQHEKCRDRLIAAINADAQHIDIQKIDEQLASLIAAIEGLDLNDPQDIKRQIGFFLSQSEMADEARGSDINMRSVENLVSRYADRLSAAANFKENGKYISSKLDIHINGQHYSSREMIELSEARVSLFSTEFRYQFTSIGNARFYDATPSDFVGKHVLDVIGKQRFAQRAKARMEKCFSGLEQRYFHFLPNETGGDRLMDCHMTPYYDSDDSLCGACVSVEDITDKFQGARDYAGLQD